MVYQVYEVYSSDFVLLARAHLPLYYKCVLNQRLLAESTRTAHTIQVNVHTTNLHIISALTTRDDTMVYQIYSYLVDSSDFVLLARAYL